MAIDESNVGDFIKHVIESAEEYKITSIDKFISRVQEDVDDAGLEPVSELIFSSTIRDLAIAIKTENTNLLRAMPCTMPLTCGKYKYDPKEKPPKCNRCAQLEQREK